jgi:hypothetical protein
MIVRTSPRLARLGPRLRDAALVLFALFVAHDAIYIAQYGAGDAYSRAMSAGGHDAYWTPTSLVLGMSAAVIFVLTLRLLGRLRREAADAPASTAGTSYLQELGRTWLRLFPTVAVLFVVQENAEHLATDGHLHGLAFLAGSPTLPVLAATTFVLAAVGSLLRWRIRSLEARLAAAARARFAPPVAMVGDRGWRVIAAAIAHFWILGRRDAGRAPPTVLRPIVVTTA